MRPVWMIYRDAEGTWAIPVEKRNDDSGRARLVGLNTYRVDADAFFRMYNEGVTLEVYAPGEIGPCELASARK